MELGSRIVLKVVLGFDWVEKQFRYEWCRNELGRSVEIIPLIWVKSENGRKNIIIRKSTCVRPDAKYFTVKTGKKLVDCYE